MTGLPTLLLLFLAGLGIGAAVVVPLMRRRARRLERLLENQSVKLEQLELQFARFAPLDVVERLVEDNPALQPSRRPVTVLFADLQGFTRMCDRLDPAETVTILNEYFQRMNRVIAGHHGRVTELVGDELLALFGALEPNPWQARDAVLAALAMREELARYNAALKARVMPELHFGIGIHRGEVLAGVIGHDALSKFGVVGDPINVASRVERLTRVHGVDLLITDDVREAVDGQFRLRPMPAMEVKGKEVPIATYHVQGPLEAPLPPGPSPAPAHG